MTEPEAQERITVESLISRGTDDIATLHQHRLERWKHVSAIVILVAGGSIVTTTILAPWEFLGPFREKAWTILTVLIGSAVAYLFSRKNDD